MTLVTMEPAPLSDVRAFELRPLDWDTAFFDARMGAVVPGQSASAGTARELRRLLDEAKAQGYAHLIFRAGSDDFPAIWAAESAGMRLVDVGVDSTATQLHSAPAATVGLVIRVAREQDLPTLRDVAAEAFTLSRFSADPFFSLDQVREFHRTWTT